MRNRISIVCGTLFLLAGGWAAAASTCGARTPEQAIPPGWQTQSSASTADAMSTASGSYRLRRIAVDPVLHRRWALIDNCSHPERPPRMIALSATAAGLPVRNTNMASIEIAAARRSELIHNRPVVVRSDVSTQSSSALLGTQNAAKSSASTGPKPDALPAIHPSHFKMPLVRAGDRVHLWSSGPNVRLELEVIALDYGYAGQVIYLRRKGENTPLTGVVVGQDSAELMP